MTTTRRPLEIDGESLTLEDIRVLQDAVDSGGLTPEQVEHARESLAAPSVKLMQTVASAIRIGNPASWDDAVAARDESGGRIEAVTDEEILAAYTFLAGKVGVFCEPASAAGVAGIMKFASDLPVGPVVCTVTGHGLKDPDTATSGITLPHTVAATTEAVAAAGIDVKFRGHLGLLQRQVHRNAVL